MGKGGRRRCADDELGENPPVGELVVLDDGVSVEVRTTDFEEGYGASLKLISIAGLVGRMQAMQAVVAAQPNAKELTDAVRKSVRDRWFDPKSFPSAGGASGMPQRYYGAR